MSYKLTCTRDGFPSAVVHNITEGSAEEIAAIFRPYGWTVKIEQEVPTDGQLQIESGDINQEAILSALNALAKRHISKSISEV